MKIYSIITICITLGLFYSLAVIEQKKKANIETQKAFAEKLFINKAEINCKTTTSSAKQSFEMSVTGKEHRYLNTGISFMEFDIEPAQEKEENVYIVSND